MRNVRMMGEYRMLTKKQLISLAFVVTLGVGAYGSKEEVRYCKHVVASTSSAGAVNVETEYAEDAYETVTPAAIATSDAVATTEQSKEQLAIKTKKIVLGKGEKVTIPFVKKLKKVKYVINKYGVISISNAGVITGSKVGNVSVKITHGDESVTLKVQVKKKPTKVLLKEPKVDTVSIGTKIPLKLILGKNEASYHVTWKSSQKKVATVSKNGVITVKGTGLTVVKATTYNGKVGKIKLRFQ